MKKTPCSKMFTISEFGEALVDRGITFRDFFRLRPMIYDWWRETDNMTIDELCDDFIDHFELSVVSSHSNS
jgi:hypothetical protein